MPAVAFAFDRQTFLYFIAGKLWNGKSSQYDNWAPSNPARARTSPRPRSG